jgi:hypothetical protein
MQRLWVAGVFPGMNEIIAARGQRRGKWDAYNAMKQKWTGVIQAMALAQRFKRVESAEFTYLHRQPHARRDPSNLAFGAQKIMEDALVGCGLLANDGQDNVLSFAHGWLVDKDVQGVTLFVGDRLLTKEEAIQMDNEARKRR